MDEILEALRELEEKNAFSLALPTDDDLLSVEEAVLIGIPHDLRTFLRQASDVSCGTMEPVTAADPRSHTYLPDVAARAWDIGLPREYLPVCEYDDGFACIGQDGKVLFWKDGDMRDEWEDFWYWCQDVWLASVRRS